MTDQAPMKLTPCRPVPWPINPIVLICTFVESDRIEYRHAEDNRLLGYRAQPLGPIICDDEVERVYLEYRT